MLEPEDTMTYHVSKADYVPLVFSCVAAYNLYQDEYRALVIRHYREERKRRGLHHITASDEDLFRVLRELAARKEKPFKPVNAERGLEVTKAISHYLSQGKPVPYALIAELREVSQVSGAAT